MFVTEYKFCRIILFLWLYLTAKLCYTFTKQSFKGV